ncbi:reticulon-3-B-like isoform X3 [Lethenteron reissneri]|uniref:reticulon-3-B-like isoform X3 n=1 Tax=Lethenteron reissneri TaxID=7753 RepID=UPI002AB7D258|nr:reticulon-3-B-like isoform X3 [Lethenteron reissneri]
MEGGDGASAWISDRASAKDGTTQQETEPQKHRETAPWPGRDQHRSDSPDITYAPADTTSFSVKDPTGEGSPTPLGTSSQRPPRHLHDSDSDHNDEYEDDDDDDADSILDLVNPSQAVYRPHGSSLGDLGGLDDFGVEGIGAERSPDEAVKGVAVKEVGASSRRDVRDGGYGDAKVDDDEDDQVDEEVDLYRAGPQGAGGKEEVRGWTADGGGVTEALRDVVELLLWREPLRSGAVSATLLGFLLALTTWSIVSVLAYGSLAVLSLTLTLRVYRCLLKAVQKSDAPHPFQEYLDKDLAVSPEVARKYSDASLARVNRTLRELQRLFLVHDLLDSIKFAVFVWLLTYVGAIFNGLTIVIIVVVGLFTIPVVYEKHQAQIDQYVELIRGHINGFVAKVQAKIPGSKRKEE